MAKINKSRISPSITTYEGAPARRIDAEAQLRRSVMSCLLWEKEFYENGQSIADRILEGVHSVKPEIAAEIAIEAREKMHLRHAPLWIVRAMAQNGGGKIIGDTLGKIIQRADELAEFLALYWKDGRCPISKQVKRGLALAFPKFNAYQLAKYNRDGTVKLRDVLFLCHAKPKNKEQEVTWKKLIDGTLESPDTWEVSLSAGKDKKTTWERLIGENKLGGLAMIRNLRNMLAVEVPESTIRQGLQQMKVDRVLPFRFIAAARYAPQFEPELEAKMLQGLEAMDKLQGKTAILVDHSGSMNYVLSDRSELLRFDAAVGVAIVLRELCESVNIIAFSAPKFQGDKGYATVAPRRGFALRDALIDSVEWWGTNTEDAKQEAERLGYDRIVIITDEQSHQAISNPTGIGYMINVASAQNGIGYGRWTHIDGWSENVVKYILKNESTLHSIRS